MTRNDYGRRLHDGKFELSSKVKGSMRLQTALLAVLDHAT